MRLAILGMGRMGMNMARRLMQKKHKVVVWNRTAEKAEVLAEEGAIQAKKLEDLANLLSPPRVVWMMLPAGPVVDECVGNLLGILSPGDILVDGGNSYYIDDQRRADLAETRGIHYMDAGVSGGIWGLANGYCVMVGGRPEVVRVVEPAILDLVCQGGYLHCGPLGSGHYVKMVHNGIEYAMMEAYGEGFDLLQGSPFGQDLDLAAIAHLWNHGSVVKSWLLELLASALDKDPRLEALRGRVDDSGEGRWTVLEAVKSGVAAPVIAQSLFRRFDSRQDDVFSNKVLAALRQEFGGHAVARAGDKIKDQG